MSSRFLSQAMFDSIISNYTTVFLGGVSAKQFADRAFHGYGFRLRPNAPRLFSRILQKCAHHSNPSHKKFLLPQQHFYLPFQQKDNHKFRQRQKQNHQKKTAFSISPPACAYNSIFKTTFRQSIRISCALKDIFSGFAARIIFAAVART